MYRPVHTGDGIADVLYGKGAVWVVCVPDTDVEVCAGERRLQRTHTSMSLDPTEPSCLYGYACDPTDAVTVNAMPVCLGPRLDPLRSLPQGLLVTTLFRSDAPDARLLDVWRWHYRTRHGAQGFLVYDNAGQAEDAIPWPLLYFETTTAHRAQSLQLLHAALVCHLFAPPQTWLLNVDLDEFLWSMAPLRTITTTLTTTSYDTVGARCMWADAGDVEAAVRTGEGLRASPFTFAWPQRAKYAQRHDALETVHRGIHAPAPGAQVLRMTPLEGRLIHFAYASGAARSDHILLLPTAEKFFA